MFGWVKRLFRRFGDHGAEPPERLIDLPSFRDPSDDLIRRLREMDSRAEVFYVGDGVWWLGRVKADAPRRAEGRAWALRLRQGDGFASDQWLELKQALLMSQGFAVLRRWGRVRIQGEPDLVLVEQMRRFLYEERVRPIYDPVGEDAEAKVKESLKREREARDRELYSWLRARRRGNVLVGAVNNARTGRLL